MAFAIANSCGEQGRTYFHRLCRISEKYRPTDADKLYNNALKDGRRKIRWEASGIWPNRRE